MYVTGYHLPGAYVRPVDYRMNLGQVRAIKSMASHCKQYVKIECYVAVGMDDDYWVNIYGDKVPWTVDDDDCACLLPSACTIGYKG